MLGHFIEVDAPGTSNLQDESEAELTLESRYTSTQHGTQEFKPWRLGINIQICSAEGRQFLSRFGKDSWTPSGSLLKFREEEAAANDCLYLQRYARFCVSSSCR